MNKAAIFLWLALLMILSGMLWYFTQWWFILTFISTWLLSLVASWMLVNYRLKRKKCKWRYKFSFNNMLCFFEEWHGLDFYWLEKPSPKDWSQLRRRENEALEKEVRARNFFK